MSSRAKQWSSKGFHFHNKKDVIRCPTDVNLNGSAERGLEDKAKRFDSLLDFCTKVADELPQRQAFYAVDLADVLWKIQEWKRVLPDVEIFYAMKANANPVLLQLLTTLGLSFDCASAEEIKMALNAGASSSDIIFAHTIKPVEDLEFASERGVSLMTFDSEEELLKIYRVYPGARLVIRLAPSGVKCLYDLSDKFGCSHQEAVRLLKLAKDLDLNVVGVSFHVGGLCDDPQAYASTIRQCRSLFDEARKVGFDLSILDIGAGFFGHLGSEETFYKTADIIKEALKEHFDDLKVRIIAEPGTFVVCSAFRLVLSVLGRRCFDNAEEGRPRRQYYLNDSIYGSFTFRGIELFSIRPVALLPESELQSRAKYQSRIFGQTCSSEDVICRNVTLPDLKIGERVLWENMGAYCLGVCSTFCGTLRPIHKYVFLHDERLKIEWVKNKKSVETFLKKHVVFIGREADEI